MNDLWEIMMAMKDGKIKETSVRFQLPQRYSPYMEISNPCLNQDFYDSQIVEVNPYYRFYDIFRDLYQPDDQQFPQVKAGLFNLILHLLAQNDCRSGMTKEEYYKKFLRMDIQDKVFGAGYEEMLSLFTKQEIEIILCGMLRQFETGNSLLLFKDMINALVDQNIVYVNNRNPYEILLYIGQKKRRELELQIEFIINLFLDIRYQVEFYYEYHFGIMGIDDTMILDEIAMC